MSHYQVPSRKMLQRETERDASESRYRHGSAAARAFEIATMILDKSGIVRYYNAAAACLFRASTWELARRHITALIPGLPFNAETPGYNVAYAAFWAAGGRWRVFGGEDTKGSPMRLHVLMDKLELEGDHQILLILRQAAGSEQWARRATCA